MPEFKFNPDNFLTPGGALPVPKREAPASYSPLTPGHSPEEGKRGEPFAGPLVASQGFPVPNRGQPTAPASEGSKAFPGAPRGSDTVPAWLTPKEFVVNAASAQANRGLLEYINKLHGPIADKKVPTPAEMASGGSVGQPQYKAKGGFLDSVGRLLGRPKAFSGREQRRLHREQRYGRKQFNVGLQRTIRGRVRGPQRLARSLGLDVSSQETRGSQYGASDSAGAFTGLGEAFGKVSEMAEKIPGPFGRVIEYGTKFAEVLVKSIDALKNWSEDLHKFNMMFAEFSGGMAAVAAKQEVRDILLSLERGNRLAGSAEFLAEGKSELAQKTAPLEDAFQKSKALIAGELDRILAKLIDISGLTALGQALNAFLDLVTPAGNNQQVDDSSTPEDFLKKFGKPKRF